ncbi:NAD(P)-dependent alcohol dehydrogenase [Paraconexibacter sp.]|uniref:NAD(P)-dependent alcohol dehydrogenase n=1 Tax=Paraconexibacter sp. TaxID=2949640 RepID=UPI00356A51C7
MTPSAVGDRDATATAQAAPDRMRAIVQPRYGDADVLAEAEIAVPEIADDEVLVEIRAAGIDRGTWHLMTGLPYVMRLGFGLRAPKTPVPGLDLAGVVTAVGAGVTRFAPGDEVVGIGKGSLAQYAAAREDKLAHKPSTLSFEQAAAVAVSGMTALQGLTEVGGLQAGQHVLITGASGGVGSYAVQIAKALGATVTGVSSTAKTGFVRELGADHVIDYTHEDFADGRDRYDLILDVGGNASLSRLRRALTPRGTLVITGGEDGGRWIGGTDRQLRALALSPFIGQRLTTYIAREHHAGLERLLEMIVAGQVVPAVDRVYRLDEAPEAMRHLAAGQARGKVVVTVGT